MHDKHPNYLFPSFSNIFCVMAVDLGEIGNVNLSSSKTAFNTVYVGVKGAPQPSDVNAPKMISNIPSTDRVAEKPYLVEVDGQWFVQATGLAIASQTQMHGTDNQLAGQ